MTELVLLDSFSQVNHSYELLNNDEYAYITGSIILVKNLDKSVPFKYLESETSGFNSFTYNRISNLLITTEGGTSTTITIYHYDKEAYASNQERKEHRSRSRMFGFSKVHSFCVDNSLGCEALCFSRDSLLMACLFNEPLLEVKVYDLSQLIANIKEEIKIGMSIHSYDFRVSSTFIKEIVSVKTKSSYKRLSFNPLNSNSISSLVLFSHNLISYIEITDAFPQNYQTKFRAFNDEITDNIETIINVDKQIRQDEEDVVVKKYKINHKKADLDHFEFIDYAWDSYSNIYVACSSNEIFLLNNSLVEITPKFKEEVKSCIMLPEKPYNLIYTQRYLLCTTEDSKILFINPYIPPQEHVYFKSMLGAEDKYLVFTVDKDYSVNGLAITGSIKYDYRYKRLFFTTKEGSFCSIQLPSDGLIKDREKDELDNIVTHDTNIISPIDCYEESKAHLYDIENLDGDENYLNKVVGIKEIPFTTQLLSIADDQKLIFWELSQRMSKLVFLLEYQPSCFEIDSKGEILIVGSELGTIRIYDISQKYSLKLIHQTKYLTKENNKTIERIKISRSSEFVCFCSLNDNIIYFISGEIKKNYCFLGFIQTPFLFLDISLVSSNGCEDLIVLCKQILLSYNINKPSLLEAKNPIKISNKKNYNILNNFELKFDIKARKVDSDLNFIVRNSINFTEDVESIWLVGEDRYFRNYKIPNELLDQVKESKKSPDKPIEEIKAHELSVVDAEVYKEYLISCSDDGFVQIRINKNLAYQFRSHNFHKNGVSCIYFNYERNLVYAGGQDGSIFVLGLTRDVSIPLDIGQRTIVNEDLEIADVINYMNDDDEDLKSFEEAKHYEYLKQIKSQKNTMQNQLKQHLENIKSELNKYITENSKEETIEQLSLEEMVIDNNRIVEEKARGEKMQVDLNRDLFYELVEKELYKRKLYEKTFELMTTRNSNDKIINNNLRIYSNLTGDKELKSFPLRKFTDKELDSINHAKQLRIIELMDKYKRRELGIQEVLDEGKFTNMNEEYLVNRISAQVELKETEINPNDIQDNEADGMRDDKAKFKAAKYKLQKDPYENFGIKFSKQEDNTEAIKYRPEEQLLKEDLSTKYKTTVCPTVDIDIKIGYKDIDTFSLLYSPFELYTTFRMRTQIFLILDIIQQLKINFNKELAVFFENRQALISKFNANKQFLLENLKDVLTENIDEEYTITENQFQDNDWVNKFSETEVSIPKYYSKEERDQIEREDRVREERLKALQGDTFEMRGLKAMIAPQQKKKNDNQAEEEELVKEPWMDKDNSKWTEEEIKKYNEYLRKEKEIMDRKEKIKSQKITKMNNIKMDMDNLKADMESKFLKILKKKLYYDYKITEQEMYVLSLLRIQEYRFSIKIKSEEVTKLTNVKKLEKEKFEKMKNLFEENYREFLQRQQELEHKFAEKNKLKFDDLPHEVEEFTKEEREELKDYRLDPIYFEIRKRMKQNKKVGSKKYPEFMKQGIKEDLIASRNLYLYYDYKAKKFAEQSSFLREEYDILDNIYKDLEKIHKDLEIEDQKLKLNFDILVRINRSQDEITDITGPQNYVDQALLIDKFLIDTKNMNIDKLYTDFLNCEHTSLMNKGTETENSLDLAIINLRKYDIELKSRYLKLTRVTKKIQEIVTGREDVNQKHIVEAYEQKKKNLEESKKKKLKDIEESLAKMRNEIEKKKIENVQFTQKYDKLSENVKLKKTIVDLDNKDDDDEFDEDGRDRDSQMKEGKDLISGVKTNKKAKELAQVTKLKNLIQNYYEEIEYLRSELDKLRARTFPSFLQKPDQVIYPDEK